MEDDEAYLEPSGRGRAKTRAKAKARMDREERAQEMAVEPELTPGRAAQRDLKAFFISNTAARAAVEAAAAIKTPKNAKATKALTGKKKR